NLPSTTASTFRFDGPAEGTELAWRCGNQRQASLGGIDCRGLSLAPPALSAIDGNDAAAADDHVHGPPPFFLELVVLRHRNPVRPGELWDRECRSWWRRRPARHRHLVRGFGEAGRLMRIGRELTR